VRILIANHIEAYSGRSYGFPLAQVGDPLSLGRPRT
jgi:hypothetical protein